MVHLIDNPSMVDEVTSFAVAPPFIPPSEPFLRVVFPGRSDHHWLDNPLLGVVAIVAMVLVYIASTYLLLSLILR